jgi:hypothetical protein
VAVRPTPSPRRVECKAVTPASDSVLPGDSEQNRCAARRVVLRLVGAGHLQRIRAHDAGGSGAQPDRYVAVT